jgi:hypothetical protein
MCPPWTMADNGINDIIADNDVIPSVTCHCSLRTRSWPSYICGVTGKSSIEWEPDSIIFKHGYITGGWIHLSRHAGHVRYQNTDDQHFVLHCLLLFTLTTGWQFNLYQHNAESRNWSCVIVHYDFKYQVLKSSTMGVNIEIIPPWHNSVYLLRIVQNQ